MRMLRVVDWPSSVRQILGWTVRASDGRIGWVRDLYLEDRNWTVRHVVVDTLHRLGSRRVLLPPEAIEHVDRAGRAVQTGLTGRQVSLGPSSDLARPVSGQHGLDLGRYYRFPSYVVSVGAAVVLAPAILDRTLDAHYDRHLRSVRAIRGYHVHALDGDVGRAADFLIEHGSWEIGHLVTSVGLWWPARTVLVPVGWIAEVSWGAGTVEVSLPAEAIRLAPEYDAAVGLGPDYEERIEGYYGRAPFGSRRAVAKL
jgi:hypothetical protein